MSDYRCPVCEKTFTDINVARADITIHDNTIRNILSNFTKFELIDMVLNNMTVSDKRDYITKWEKE